jgi:N-ethylmaleimide reductase
MHTQKKLITPIQIGPITLKHRVVMPPMSRLRAQWPSGIPSDLQLEYYRQRASEGGLIFTEATAISTSGRGYKGAPGLYSDEQVTGWNASRMRSMPRAATYSLSSGMLGARLTSR